MRSRQLLLTACLLAALGCDVGDNISLDLTEVLTVNVLTVGTNLDDDGYLISVTGGPDETIGINETRLFNVLRIDVTVTLGDVADNCTVDVNPQTVSVRGPTTVSFLVRCS